MAQSSTLLSDCITRCIEQDTRENYEHFLQVFLGSQLGVILKGIPHGISGQYVAGNCELTAAMGSTPDGKKMLLACADRAIFVQRFPQAFNAEVDATSDWCASLVSRRHRFYSPQLSRTKIRKPATHARR